MTNGAACSSRRGRIPLLCSGNGPEPAGPRRADPDRQRHAPGAAAGARRRRARRHRGGRPAAGAGATTWPTWPASPRGCATRGWRRAGRPGVVTYSRKVFIPLTRLCRDRCHYCTFVTVPGKLRRAGQAMFLSPDEVLDDRPRRAPRWAARRRCSPSATGPRTAGPRPASGSTRTATTPRSPTCGRWRSGCSRRPGCCRTSTPGVHVAGRSCSGSSRSRRRWG